MIWASVKRLFFIRISSFDEPRKFYVPGPLFPGGITEHLLSASHRLGEDKLLWTAISLHPNGHSLRLLLSVDRVNGGHDPDWLAFPPPEGWVLVDDDGEDYAPFWLAEVPDATEVEGLVVTDAAAALAADAVAPVYAITRV